MLLVIGETKLVSLMLDKTNIKKGISERQINDYYATDPIAIDLLINNYNVFSKNIWEPACGEKYLSKRLEEKGYNVKSTDLIAYNKSVEILDFLKFDPLIDGVFEGDIITNPPFNFVNEFLEKSMDSIKTHFHVSLFLKIQILESKKRKNLFEKYPPKMILVPSKRIIVAKDGNFKETKGSAMCLCWFIFQKGFKGITQLKII